jgi:peptide chain release factor 2
MLSDELLERLKSAESDLHIITAFIQQAGIEQEYNKLRHITEQETFWQHTDQADILKSLQKVRDQWQEYQALITTHQELIDLIKIFENEPGELQQLKHEVFRHCKYSARYKVQLLLGNEEDTAACFVSINAGAGGTESQDWADMLLRMYLRFCEREKLTTAVLDYQSGETAGIKSATLYIRGNHAYGLLKGEHGIHRLVRVSPFDANKRRHTSFAGVFITPEAPHVAITIDQKDLRIDTYRASGAGGQHVNKTESAVRITHIPTNTVVQCQNERSQTQNKETAMKMLMAKLVQREREEQKAKTAKIEKKSIEWGSQIRSYVLHPYKMVKDHRTDVESPQPEVVLDGDLMPFIEAYLMQQVAAKSS